MDPAISLDPDVPLPADFVTFVRRNYERIEEIERKVEQFKNSWKNNAGSFKYLFHNLRYQQVFDSVESTFSEGDVKKVITAKVTPRRRRLPRFLLGLGGDEASSGGDESGDDNDDNFGRNDYVRRLLLISDRKDGQVDPETEYLTSVGKSYPLVRLDHGAGGGEVISRSRSATQLVTNMTTKAVSSGEFVIEGIHVSMTERNCGGGGSEKGSRTFDLSSGGSPSPNIIFPLPTSPSTKLAGNKGHDVSRRPQKHTNVQRNGKIETTFNFTPQLQPQLTLPPLHSSVLTLLGGLRSKPSQRGDFMTNHLQGHQGQGTISANPDQTGTTKHKKLRRHGRTRNKNGPATSDQNETASKNRAGSEEVKKVEDPNETQVSTIAAASASTALLEVDADDQAKSPTSPLPFPGDEGLENFIQNMKNFRQSRQALYSVLDDYLSGKVWSPQEMDALDTQIDGISQEFRKLETKFQTQSINLKESTWLSFPRTWSRNSATFFAPNDTKALREMKPLDYLKKYVTVSGPRKHLYSLIFQRYRTMENPTKDWIWIKTLQAAVSEVLGRPFSGDEMVQLCHYYLGEDDWERPISEAEFTGTCAFCERIYAVYSLEDNSECHTCYKTPSRFRHGCHSDQKDHLETADLAYLHTKLRDGLVPPALTHLLLALANQK
ncbi:uncharacterized protein LOC110845610 isoform X1 [Folsomia candida]|nr:uncharacterized protein LOC110845610 isoform X1 [Folsomia candida]